MSAFVARKINAWWWIPAGAALVAIWSWTPSAPVPLPVHYAEPGDLQALASLPADMPFLIAGTLQVAEDPKQQPWQGRDVYLHRERRDLGGRGTSRHIVVETIEQRRPALQLQWNGSIIEIAADSYRLDFAPRIEPRRGNAWDRSSRGFRNGDGALALGRTGRNGTYWIESLLDAPLSAVEDDIRHTRKPRMRLILAAKLIASLLILALLASPRATNLRRPTVTH